MFVRLTKIFSLLLFISLFSSCAQFYFEENSRENIVNNYEDGRFVNTKQREVMTESFLTVAYKYLTENMNNRVPKFDIPTVDVNVDSFASENNKLSVIWLGHASVLINIDGTIILTDPMLTKWASPIGWFGPKRFFNSPIDFEDFPNIDAIIISHNHYDHLDRESVLSLNGITKKFIVPIGVKSTLTKWGILSEKIIEKNWNENYQLNDNVKIITTPAHHFSGRSLFDKNKTLWASFVVKSKNHSIYFGGDSGFFAGYSEIGKKYGPFDITVLPIGAYSKMWKSIHMDAEEAVQAHLDLNGDLLLPIHWGTFNLALHGWTEPAEHLITSSVKKNVKIVIPKPGEVVNSDLTHEITKWWMNSEQK